MSSLFRNVIIAGATALLDEPSFNVTILSRTTSSAKFPANIPVKKVSDDYTVAELTEAFQGQDAVVVALSTSPVTKDGKDGLAFRLIDAALAAGVKRFIPSDFAANNLDPRARNLVPVYDRKGEMLAYLIATAKDSNGALIWSSVSCGSWLDWALNPAKSGNFLGIDVKGRRAQIYDSGRSRYAVTTSTNTGLAVATVLLNPEISENKQIFRADFMTTSRDIVESLEKQTREKFVIEVKESKPQIKALREKFDAGDYDATYPLLRISFAADVDVGYDFEKEQELWNSKLGLPNVTLEEVVKEAIELAHCS